MLNVVKNSKSPKYIVEQKTTNRCWEKGFYGGHYEKDLKIELVLFLLDSKAL